MKKTIMFTTLLATMGLAGIAQKNKLPLAKIEKQIQVASFDHLTVDGNFKLTLVENDEPAIQVKGSPRFVNTFKLHQSQKKLRVKSFYDGRPADNEIIINVKNLKTLILRNEGFTNTNGMLLSENLDILLDAECIVKVNNRGKTNIRAGENFELVHL
jgi:Putative auto-transporter adhesin, head GIN domain